VADSQKSSWKFMTCMTLISLVIVRSFKQEPAWSPMTFGKILG